MLSAAGIDISKRYLDCCLQQSNRQFRLTNDLEGVNTLIACLFESDVTRVLIEATGGYEKLLRHELGKVGIEVVCINPRRVRNFAEAMGMEAKTDKIDAQVLAEFAASLKVYKAAPFSVEHDQLSEQIKQRDRFVQHRDDDKRRCQQSSTPVVIDRYQAHIDFLQAQIKEIESLIARTMKEMDDQTVKRLMAIKGIGLVTASNLVCYLPELGSLSRGKIAKLVGVAPFNRDSGEGSKPRYVRGGRGKIRRVLYMAAWVMVRYDAGFKARYERLRERGKCAKVAIVACMRVLIVRLNAMLRDGTPWRSEVI
jgi:transposase